MKKKEEKAPFKVGDIYVFPDDPEIVKYLEEISQDVNKELIKQGAAYEVHGKVLVPLESFDLKYQIEKRILKERYGIDWQSPVDRSKNMKLD